MSDAEAKDNLFEIGAEGVDAGRIVAEIRAAVQEKLDAGVYPDPVIARAERFNLRDLQSHEAFMDYYMRCLREAAWVDINDFDIRERRRFAGPVLRRIKTALWKLLKFYTYRLWSQQNQVNGLLVAAVDGMDRKSARRIQALEARIRALEERLDGGSS